MCNHTYTELRKPDGTMERYDDEFLEIMPLLWERGIVDRFECQGEAYFVDQTRYENRAHRAYLMLELNEASLKLASDLFETFPAFREEKVMFTVTIDRAPTPRWQHKDADDISTKTRLTLRFPNQEIPKLLAWLQDQKHRVSLTEMLEEVSRSTGEDFNSSIEEFMRSETNDK